VQEAEAEAEENAVHADLAYPAHPVILALMVRMAMMANPAMSAHPDTERHQDPNHLHQFAQTPACHPELPDQEAHQDPKVTKVHPAMLRHQLHLEMQVHPALLDPLAQLDHPAKTKTKVQKVTTVKLSTNQVPLVHQARQVLPVQLVHQVQKVTTANQAIHQLLVHPATKAHLVQQEKITNLVPKVRMAQSVPKVRAITVHQPERLLVFSQEIVTFLCFVRAQFFSFRVAFKQLFF